MMASSNRCCVRWTSAVVILFAILQFRQFGVALGSSFCPATLSRPTCPDLPTYDTFDITTYGGRWYEIGSSANFKNLQESGGICVLANYTLQEPPSRGKGAVIIVDNTLYSLGAANHNVSQIVISISTGAICSQAFTICAQVDQKTSPLASALALITNVSLSIADDYSKMAASLAIAVLKIEVAIAKIDIDLDFLSKAMTDIQIENAKLGQGQGKAALHVASLVATAAAANVTTLAIAKEVQSIEKERKVVESVGSQLAEKKGDDLAANSSSELTQSAKLITAAEDAISGQVQAIQTSLAAVVGLGLAFLTPGFGKAGYTAGIIGQGVQNASFAGKLEVSFSGFGAGNYWILAVEEDANYDGYAATLVYGCDEEAGGGIEETLFVLSRTPSLPESTLETFFRKAAELGVSQDCSSPFIFTVQDPELCESPTSFILP